MEFRFLKSAARLAVILVTTATIPAATAEAQNPGGFLEKATSANVRPRYTAAEIKNFLPAGRGPFNFPPPYNTDGARLTVPGDCGGQDCVFSIGYSYWRNINNHQGSSTMLIVLGLNQNRGGTGPTLFSYNKTTDQVTNLGPLFPAGSGFRGHSSEGWYFSATQPNSLYVIGYGTQLYRLDVMSKTMTTVFDISTQTGLFGTNRYAIQAHSSADDKVHSATVRDKANDKDLGCMVYKEATKQYLFYKTLGLHYDECQIDKSGRFLLIKDRVSTATSDVDNRIIDLSTNTETRLLQANGAVGHSDNGNGYSVGALINSAVPGVVTVWKYGQNPLQGTQVYRTTTWNGGVGHIAHSNAKAGLAQNQQIACGSNASRVNDPRLNEIVCFRLDTSMDVLVVAPVMTDLNAAGGDGGGCGDYCKSPKGNLDVTGGYFIWTTNMAGGRQDAFIVKVPTQLLGGTTAPPPPATDTTPPSISAVAAPLTTSSGATVTWTTNEASDSQVEYGVTTGYGSATALNGSMVTSHSQSLSGLAANTLYHYRVKSRDAAGNLAVSPDATFTTTAGGTPSLGGDTTPPAVAVTAPAAGRVVTGQISVTASASDNVGVVGVQFKIDGQNLGTEDTVRPFARAWNTATFTNGTHTITAVARDKAGNTKTSQPVTVTVSGGTITGAVTWTNIVNATANGGSLQESCGGCGNSGAQSVQRITSGSGYVEFTAVETTTQRSVGLSNGNSNNLRADIDFAIALWNGSPGRAEVYENGTYKFGSVPYVTGDVFRISVASGVVKYSKNGAVFYTSAKAPLYPLLVDASLAGPGSTIANGKFSGK